MAKSLGVSFPLISPSFPLHFHFISTHDEIAQEKIIDAVRKIEPIVGAEDVNRQRTHWDVAFEVVTPPRWRRIIDVALMQAMDGDPRARDWLARLLGAEDAGAQLEAQGARAHPAGFRDILEAHRREAED